MDTVLTGNIWKQVGPLARAAKRRLVAVAYVSSAEQMSLKKGDLLICDASHQAIGAGGTSARVLAEYLQDGVEVRSHPRLHAKVAVFGRHALIGSCNLSSISAEVLAELALVTDRQQVVSQAAAFIHGLRGFSEEIDEDGLQRLLKIKVRKPRSRSPARSRRAMRIGSRAWLVSVRELAAESFPKEQSLVKKAKAISLLPQPDAEISWIRWTGKGRFRTLARRGDIIIQIWQSVSGKRTTVYPPYPIVYRQDVAHWTRFYVAESDDPNSMSWARFQAQAKIRGLTRISRGSVRELTPREVLLIESLCK